MPAWATLTVPWPWTKSCAGHVGSFRFHADQMPAEDNLDGDTMAILLEGLRRMDESSVLEKPQDSQAVAAPAPVPAPAAPL